VLAQLRREDDEGVCISSERRAAHWADQMKGVGPKQSRNLWQLTGLFRYDMPKSWRMFLEGRHELADETV
jgi:hypothetical protein